MSTTQLDAKCPACHRVVATHAAGCSVIDCPNRHPQVWGGPEGLQGFPGLLAEDRIIARRRDTSLAVPMGLDDL